MPDFHHNIFYYYKGASDSDPERDRQLEDNTTKALVNVLEHCSPVVSEQFLSWLGVPSSGEITFCLQRQTIGNGLIQLKKTRLLLGIVPTCPPDGMVCAGSKEGKGSRPDAWIYGEDFVVLIETKVVGGLDPSQIGRHVDNLRAGSTIEPAIAIKSWPDIYRFFSSVDGPLTDKDEWLLQQFLKYLEWSNMSDFIGFEPESFEFFYGSKDPDARKWLRNSFGLFASALLEKLIRLDSFYEGYDIGKIRENDDHCWVAFGPENGKYRKFAHQSVSITPFGLEVFFNVETSDAVRRLRKFMNNFPLQFKDGILSLENLEAISVIVIERSQRQVSLYDYAPVAQIEGEVLHSQLLREKSFEYISYLVNEVPFPQLKLQFFLTKNDVVSLKTDIVEEVFSVMKKFHPVVKMVNGGR